MHTGCVTRDGDNRQFPLFDHTDYEKLEKLDRAVDSIRTKFGTDAIQRAVFLKKDGINHIFLNIFFDLLPGNVFAVLAGNDDGI